jgi:hypothetical protein
MADNRRRDNREERHEEPREEKKGGDKQSSVLTGLWNTPLGKLLTLWGLKWILPTDKILEQVLVPGLKAGGSLYELAKNELVLAPLRRLKRYALDLLSVGVVIFWICLGLVLAGISSCHSYYVAAAGVVWTTYLVYCLVQIRFVGKALAELASSGLNLAQSVLGKLLGAIGLARPAGKGLSIETKTVDDAAVLMQYVIAVSLAATVILSFVTFVSTTPPWLSTGVLLLGAVAALAAVSLSSIRELGIDTKPTWRALNRYMKYVALVAIAFGAVNAVFPSLAHRIVVWHSAADGLVADSHLVFQPWMLIALPALIAVLGMITAAYHGKVAPQKSAAWSTVAKCALWAIPITIVIMAYTGTLTYPKDIKGPARRFATGSSVAAAPASARQRLAPTAPAPKPDFTGQSSRQIVDDLLK